MIVVRFFYGFDSAQPPFDYAKHYSTTLSKFF